MTSTYIRNSHARFAHQRKKPPVDPRGKSSLWRVKRALRQFRAARWNETQAYQALATEGLTATVIMQELEKRTAHDANMVKRAGIEQRKKERAEKRAAKEAAKADRAARRKHSGAKP